MCGICGIVMSDSRRPVRRQTLARMTDVMRHRGPDSEGLYASQGVGLGVRRLSIIDIATGDQPIFNEDQTLLVVCNGEIYNFVELRRELMAAGHRFRTGSDVETIVHLYEEHGPDCVHRLRGMFAFALWDKTNRRLMLARDRLGIKPLYYATSPDGLCFGSEIKPILLSGWVKPQMDARALGDLMAFGFGLGPQTMFAGVSQLLPGHYMLCHDGQITQRRYWRVDFGPARELATGADADVWAEALLEKLGESVRLHLRSDVPVGAWLSAGIDSSAVTALASRLTGRPIRTFSLAFENPDYDEVSRQKTLADFPQYNIVNQRVQCGSKDFELLPKVLWHAENVSSAATELLQWILAKAAAQQVKVVLTGEGSDELLGGYGWFRVQKLLGPLAALPLPLRKLMLLGPLVGRLFPGAARVHASPARMNLTRYQNMVGPGNSHCGDRLLSHQMRRQLDELGPLEERWSAPPGFEKWHPFNKLQYFEFTFRLPNFITHQADRISMAHSLEVRVPFLDHELVEFCARIPPALKMRRLSEKYILRLAVRGLLPRQIARRPKRGLRAPYEQWFSDKLPDFAADMLSQTALRKKGYFDPVAVADLLARQRRGECRCGQHLLAVLAVQLWDDIFMCGHVENAPS